MKPDVVAHHEAGHAVVATVLATSAGGRPVVSVTIERTLGFKGHCELVPLQSFATANGYVPDELIAADLAVTLAGPIAEQRYTSDSTRTNYGIDEDRRQAMSEARDTLRPEQVESFLKEAERVSAETVETHWPAILAVAARLLVSRTLTGSDVQEIIAGAATG